MIRSYWELGDILHFDPDTARRNMELGYYDTRRAMGYLRGCAYAVSTSAESCEDAAAFAWKFQQVQKAVREKYPVTLTADAALLLANMKDAQLAPLEAAAEDAGVDPTVFYTTRTLAEAFWKNATGSASRALRPCLRAAAMRHRPHGLLCCPIRSYRHWSAVPLPADTAGGDRRMKVYQGHSASPGLVMGQVSRLERWHENFATGPFNAEREQRLLENAVRTAQRELDGMADRSGPTEQAIFLFQSMMLEDEGFMNEVGFQIKRASALPRPCTVWATAMQSSLLPWRTTPTCSCAVRIFWMPPAAW